MNKQILFFNPYCYWPFHFETDLEIIVKHIEQGDKVTVLTCDADLPSCEPNHNHNFLICQSCIHRRHQGFNVLGISDKVEFLNLVNLSKNDRQTIEEFPKQVVNLRSLKALSVHDFDIGLSVASSLIDYTREPYPNPNNYSGFVEKNIEAALIAYLSTLNHIKDIQPHKMYIFNGRFAVSRAAMRAAQSLSIDFDVHERAGVQGKYSLTANTYPHDLAKKKEEIGLVWSSSSLVEIEKLAIGSQWFTERRLGSDQSWYSFTNNQNKQPDFINKNKVNIVIFNSSQDEFEAVSGWENHIYNSQNQGIFKLAQSLQNDKDIDIYLRVHPNLSAINNSQTKAIAKLKGLYPNFHVIDPENPVKSYSLMDIADCIITFGSTMGVEAAFYNKNSLLIGRSLYEDLDVCSQVLSHNELVDIIRNKKFNLPLQILEKRKNNAIKYGFYMATYGIDFKVFQQIGLFKMVLLKNGKTLNEILSFDSVCFKLMSKLSKGLILLSKIVKF